MWKFSLDSKSLTFAYLKVIFRQINSSDERQNSSGCHLPEVFQMNTEAN